MYSTWVGTLISSVIIVFYPCVWVWLGLDAKRSKLLSICLELHPGRIFYVRHLLFVLFVIFHLPDVKVDCLEICMPSVHYCHGYAICINNCWAPELNLILSFFHRLIMLLFMGKNQLRNILRSHIWLDMVWLGTSFFGFDVSTK